MNKHIALGGGVPFGWVPGNARLMAEHSKQRVQKTGFAPAERNTPIDLLDDIPGADTWLPRDQGPRGTCTAFAVAAAEEIHAARRAQTPVVPLSVEYLYATIRSFSFQEAGIKDLTPEKEAEHLASGATYLAQAKLALQKTGICRDDLAPYDYDAAINHAQADFSDEAHQDAADRHSGAGDLAHGIVRLGPDRPAVGLDQVWEPPINGSTVSSIFIDALEQGSPVVAAFAILDRGGSFMWFGRQPTLCGTVTYPEDADIDRYAPAGGHTVCITGYVPPPAGQPEDAGRFVFRNSYGIHDFSYDAGRWRCGPWPKKPGYGLISAADVDRYCWEYLFRKPHWTNQ